MFGYIWYFFSDCTLYIINVVFTISVLLQPYEDNVIYWKRYRTDCIMIPTV